MRVTVRLLLDWFALFGLVVGGWQHLAPRSFYTDFPGLGHRWVSPDGPYNEHLLRDVGQGNLAVAVVALVALLAGSLWAARATGLAAIVANLPHQAYHQAHLGRLPEDVDRVLQTATLSLVSLAAVALTVLAFRSPAPRAPAEVSGRGRRAPDGARA